MRLEPSVDSRSQHLTVFQMEFQSFANTLTIQGAVFCREVDNLKVWGGEAQGQLSQCRETFFLANLLLVDLCGERENGFTPRDHLTAFFCRCSEF